MLHDLRHARRARSRSRTRPLPEDQADAYGQLEDAPRLADGSVVVSTVFHMVSDHTITASEKQHWTTLLTNQMRVLDDACAGRTAAASDTPFRFALSRTTWTVNADWYDVVPGKDERTMEAALSTGDARTLNASAANNGGGLLGWSCFPEGHTGRDIIDGVVILDQSMPGGTAGEHPEGDTLTHEVGHWLRRCPGSRSAPRWGRRRW